MTWDPLLTREVVGPLADLIDPDECDLCRELSEVMVETADLGCICGECFDDEEGE